MPAYYERCHMETAPDGAPQKIAKARLEQRQDDRKRKIAQPGSSGASRSEKAAETPERPTRAARIKAEETIKKVISKRQYRKTSKAVKTATENNQKHCASPEKED